MKFKILKRSEKIEYLRMDYEILCYVMRERGIFITKNI